jgi:hypothetical protein
MQRMAREEKLAEVLLLMRSMRATPTDGRAQKPEPFSPIFRDEKVPDNSVVAGACQGPSLRPVKAGHRASAREERRGPLPVSYALPAAGSVMLVTGLPDAAPAH